MKNILENLELRLAQTKLENSEKFDVIETEYKEEYSDFFDKLFKNDNLGIKRYISVSFQLEKLDNPEIENKDNLKISLNKIIDTFPLNIEKKEVLKDKLLILEENKEKVSDIFIKNTYLHKNYNFPILESLEKLNFLDKNDLIKMSLKFKETNNFLDSISILSNNKRDLVTRHYYELNNTKKDERIDNFKNDFKEEIINSKNIQIYPKVLKFIWKNYFKLRLNNRLESKKDMLKRIFKIAFLKLYRLKYSWIDITSILNRIDSLDDLDSMINLLLKFFEQLKQNPNLQKDYIVSDEIDEVKEIWVEAEENKEKVLFSEKNTIKANRLLEEWEKYILWGELDELLDENVDLVWNNFIKRNIKINSWILNDNNIFEDEDVDELEEEIDLEEYYNKLKIEFEQLEKSKNKLFLEWNYDILDDINNELLELIIKLEKVSKLLWLE